MKRSEMTPDQRDVYDSDLWMRLFRTKVDANHGRLRDLFASATPDPFDPIYGGKTPPPSTSRPSIGRPGPLLMPMSSANTPQVAGVPMPSKLARLFMLESPGTVRSSAMLDHMQEAFDIMEQMYHAHSGFRWNTIPQASRDALLAATLMVVERIALIHPHANCPLCPEKQPAVQADGSDIDETNLFHWLMDNFSESKQIIAERLRRDFVITKKQA